MDRHIDSALLSALADGELNVQERASADLHLAACAACRRELDGLRGMKTILASAAVHPMPPALVARLERDFAGRQAEPVRRSLWAWPRLWVPAGALAGLLALSTAWFGVRAYFVKEDSLPLEPLLAAHSRYSAESLVPQSVPPASNVYSQLALYHGDEQ